MQSAVQRELLGRERQERKRGAPKQAGKTTRCVPKREELSRKNYLERQAASQSVMTTAMLEWI